MAQGRSVTLFMEDGDADGVITMDLHGWEGNAILIPRDKVSAYSSQELKDTGIYLLLCNSYNGERSVYIGEAIDVQKRLVRHIRDYSACKEEFFWETAIVFTAGASINKGLAQYVENRLKQIAMEVNSYTVLTKKTVGGTKLKPSAKADMETFIDNVRIIVRLLGFYVFEKPVGINHNRKSEPKKFYCKNAVMHIEDGVFVVEKGSRVAENPSSSFIKKHNYYKKYIQLKADNTIVNNEFTKDYPFSSPSAAAAIILARSANGKTEWKDEDGITLQKFIE